MAQFSPFWKCWKSPEISKGTKPATFPILFGSWTLYSHEHFSYLYYSSEYVLSLAGQKHWPYLPGQHLHMTAPGSTQCTSAGPACLYKPCGWSPAMKAPLVLLFLMWESQEHKISNCRNTSFTQLTKTSCELSLSRQAEWGPCWAQHWPRPVWHPVERPPRTGSCGSACSAQRHGAARSPADVGLSSCSANQRLAHQEHCVPPPSGTAGSHWYI